MNDVIVIGYFPGNGWKQTRAVFDLGGVCPTLVAAMGGKHMTNFVYVCEEDPRDEVV